MEEDNKEEPNSEIPEDVEPEKEIATKPSEVVTTSVSQSKQDKSKSRTELKQMASSMVAKESNTVISSSQADLKNPSTISIKGSKAILKKMSIAKEIVSGESDVTRPSVTIAESKSKYSVGGLTNVAYPERPSTMKKQHSILSNVSKVNIKHSISTAQEGRSSIVGTPEAEVAHGEIVKSGTLLPTMSTTEPGLSKSSQLGIKASTMRKISIETQRLRIAKYMNTYRLEAKNSFNPDRVNEVIRNLIDKELDGVKYDAGNCAKLCMTLSAELRTRIRLLGFDRCKLVCMVEIGEKSSQSLYSVLGFLWDVDRDNFAFYSYENTFIFAVVCVFGVYYE